jgi:hypothetical protein
MARFRVCIAALSILLATPAAHAQGSAHERLSALAHELTFSFAARYPLLATGFGIAGHDGELEQPSESFRAGTIAQLEHWDQQLRAITAGFDSSTALVDRDDSKLLGALLAVQLHQLLVYRTDRKDYALPALNLIHAVFTQFQYLPVPGREGASAADQRRAWRDITARLAAAPAYLRASQALVTMPCHLYGVVGSQELAGMPQFLNGGLSEAAAAALGAHSAEYARFVQARDRAVAALAATKAYIDAHASAWPENFSMGREAYDRMLREEQLLPFNADDVQRMGGDELAHGWAEEAWLTALSRDHSIAFGAASGGGMAPAGPGLIDYYRARIAELTNFVRAEEVVTIPAWLGTITVTETPIFEQPTSPGASMDPPRLLSGSTRGYYYITPPKSLAEAAARLDMNEDFDHDRILSTAAHEVMPGHFLQLSIARRHPDFVRKIMQDGVFAEGWAFYGEEMFVRLGLYGNDLDPRLFTARWERVRGARAVVDAALASGSWSYDQAVDFFAEQTDFTPEDARAAVAGIAAQPGYVIAYTVGRAQLESLLGEYQHRMGARGSLHDFHDRLLSYGTVPFAIVEPELLADLDKPASAVRAAANY